MSGALTVVCPKCGHVVSTAPVADRVSIHGMYDMHLFHEVEGATVDDVIANWRQHNRQMQPAIVGGREVDDMGPSSLCPAIVMSGKKELRRVGQMVFPAMKDRWECDENALRAWREAMLADPDVTRLLARDATTAVSEPSQENAPGQMKQKSDTRDIPLPADRQNTAKDAE